MRCTDHRSRVAGSALLLIALLLPGLAAADGRARVVARVGTDGAFTTDPIQAKVGEQVELAAIWIDGEGQLRGDVTQATIDGGPPRAVAPLPEATQVVWYQVIQRLHHEDLPSPNPGNPTFSNTVLYGPDHGSWLGFDRLEYETRKWMGPGGEVVRGPTTSLFVAPPSPIGIPHGGAGTSWFAAQLHLSGSGETPGQAVRTPDGEDVGNLGLSDQVLRVSYRTGDDYLGWLSSYFNVPNVFGSAGPTDAGHQTERYLGADCADVLVGALRAAGHRELAYTSISGLHQLAEPSSDVFFMGDDGLVYNTEGPVFLRWGEDVHPGDLLAINYEDDADGSLPRNWDHIGALVEDRGADGPDGLLNGHDVLRHVTAAGLADRTVLTQCPIRFRLWRWKIADEFPATAGPTSSPPPA